MGLRDVTKIAFLACGISVVVKSVEFFGENIHIEEVAEKCGTISYEILCGIGQRVTRIYVGEK